ncbi:MAG: aminopeptidase, partial [Clostridiales bacterium]|nr:aminopeptidase [Clostridiales bacterium]
MERRNAWKQYDAEALSLVEQAAAGYKQFLDGGKTERECAALAVQRAKAAGYISLREAIRDHRPVQPGDKLYLTQMNKAVILFHVGENPLEDGMNIVGAHIDSPRIDLKQNPFYEDGDFAY